MKINKLILSSVAALALAGAFAPAVDAYYQDNAGNKYETLTNIPESDYNRLLEELTTKIVSIRGNIGVEGAQGSTADSSGLIEAVKIAEDNLATSQQVANASADKLNKAKAAYNEALAALEAAETEVANLQAAVDAMEASYGEYEQKRVAAQQDHDYSVNQAAHTRDLAIADAVGLLSEAQQRSDVAIAERDVLLETVNSEDFSELPPSDQQAVRDQLADAELEVTKATNNLNQAQIDKTATESQAYAAYDAAINAAEAKLTSTLIDLEQQYINSDVYLERGSIEAAKEALYDAQEARTRAQADFDAAELAYDTAVSEDKANQIALRNDQLALAAAKARLAEAYAQKAHLEANLHELVVGHSYNSTKSLENLTKRQIEIVEEITGLTSQELAEQLAKAKADAEAAKKHAEELRNQDGEPGDGEPGDGEPGDGEPGDGEPGDGEPGDGEPGDGDDNGTPAKPVKPGTPAKPAAGSGAGKAQLPETGESSAFAIYGAAALSVLAGVGLIAKKREEA